MIEGQVQVSCYKGDWPHHIIRVDRSCLKVGKDVRNGDTKQIPEVL